MKLSFVLLADSARERGDGKLDILGAGISHLAIPELPAVGPPISMVASLELAEDDFDRSHSLQVRIRHRGGKVVTSSPEIEMPAKYTQRRVYEGENQGVVVNIAFPGLRFEEYGVYDVELAVDGKRIAQAPLAVNAEPDPRHEELGQPTEQHINPA